MQPIYLTGHSRPVHKVLYNFDGDLLFSCSDDKTVCMYNTDMLDRVGLFQINDSCKSIDVTQDSKLLFATATTQGIKVFNCQNGDLVAEMAMPGIYTKKVCLSYSNDKFCVIYEDSRRENWIRVFTVKDTLEYGINPKGCCAHIYQIKAPKDHGINDCKWGQLDKTVYYCTDKGSLLRYDLEEDAMVMRRDVNKNEIFSLTMTPDFTMLLTASRDGSSKLLHPETMDEIRTFDFKYPCRNAVVSPLYDAENNQKFHVLLCGGQDAKDVTTTGADKGGFEMDLFNIIYNEKLAAIKGHFGTVHSVAFHPDGQSFASGSEDGYVHYHRFLPEYFTKRFE
jgi:translation initiation factor 3 subunit I